MSDDRGMRLKLNKNILFIWNKNKNKTSEKMKTNQNNIVYLLRLEGLHDCESIACIVITILNSPDKYFPSYP